MKNLIITIISILAFSFSTQLMAQPIDKTVESEAVTNQANSADEAILQDYKATKAEKKVIRKMKKYVTPRILGNRKNTAALNGKKVTVQISLDEKGAIKNMQIVKGYEPIIDQRVLDFIKAYDAKNPLASSSIDQPAIIQVEIPLVRKRQYMH